MSNINSLFSCGLGENLPVEKPGGEPYEERYMDEDLKGTCTTCT